MRLLMGAFPVLCRRRFGPASALAVVLWAAVGGVCAFAQTLRGYVRDATTGAPARNAVVYLASEISAETQRLTADSSGVFVGMGLSPGLYLCSVSAEGYETLQIPELQIPSGREVRLDVELYPSATPLPDVIVRAGTQQQVLLPLGEIPLTRERTLRFPATFFDPARLALASAGIANADDQANGLLIRGNSFQNLRWRLEGVEVVNPNHLPNAGTLGDRPTTAAGGVLLFSAQLMDNSSLLTGALPPGYGDAFGGIMDIYWRQGNARRHEMTAQVGLLGLDLAAEGPLDREKRHTYLVNYRYSTVGLLGQMGISFGNEQISFQDYSFKVGLSGKKGARWSVFGVAGDSRNRFRPPGDTSAIKQFKDLFEIDFRSATGILGASWSRSPSRRTRLHVSAVWSAQRNARSAEARDVLSERDTAVENRVGISVRVMHPFSARKRLQAGCLAQYASLDISAFRSDERFSYAADAVMLGVQPWINAQWTMPDERTRLHIGVHGWLWHLRRRYPIEMRWEPRLLLVHDLPARHQLALYVGFNSQAHPLWVYALHPPTPRASSENRLEGRPLATALQASVRHSWAWSEWWRLRTEVFYQHQQRLPSAGALSLANIGEVQLLGNLDASGRAKTAGVEISVERFFAGSWFLSANVTGWRARYRGTDSIWRQSRWNVERIANLTLGKEWTFSEWPERLRAFGVNGRLTWVGGQRAAPIDTAASAATQTTTYDISNGYPLRLPDFVRLDLRVYWRRHLGRRRNSWLAFDLQNATLRRNIAYNYYDPLLRQVVTKPQLSLVPNLSWRLEW